MYDNFNDYLQTYNKNMKTKKTTIISVIISHMTVT